MSKIINRTLSLLLAMAVALTMGVSALADTEAPATVTPPEGEGEDAGVITAFAAPDPMAVEPGTQEAELPFPAAVEATLLPLGESALPRAVSLAVTEWLCAAPGGYDPEAAGAYPFAPVLDLPQAIVLGEAVDLPQLMVLVSAKEEPPAQTQMPAGGIAPTAAPIGVTDTLYYNPDDGLLHLGDPDGAVATQNTHYTGDYSGDGSALTLNGFELETSARKGLVVPDGTVIKLATGSTNAVACNTTGGHMTTALYSGGELTVQGAGTLNVTNITPGASYSYALITEYQNNSGDGNLFVKDGAALNVTGGTGSNSSRAVLADNVTVVNATLSGETDPNSTTNWDFAVAGELAIEGSGKITGKVAATNRYNSIAFWSEPYDLEAVGSADGSTNVEALVYDTDLESYVLASDGTSVATYMEMTAALRLFYCNGSSDCDGEDHSGHTAGLFRDGGHTAAYTKNTSTWSASGSTLTLDGFSLVTNHSYPLHMPAGSVIRLAQGSTNEVIGTLNRPNANYRHSTTALDAAGDLTVTGAGTLTLEGGYAYSSYGLCLPVGMNLEAPGTLTLTGGATVNASVAGASGQAAGIGVCAGSLVVEGGATLNATGRGQWQATGLATGVLSLVEGKITALADSAATAPNPINVFVGSIIATASGTADGSKTNLQELQWSGYYVLKEGGANALYVELTPKVVVQLSYCTGSGTGHSGHTAGFYTDTAHTVPYAAGAGTWSASGNTLTLNGFAYITDETPVALRLPAGTVIELAAGSVNTIATTYMDMAGTVTGIACDGDLTVRGSGSLTATGSAGNYAYGICARDGNTLKTLTVDGATLNAGVLGALTESAGIMANLSAGNAAAVTGLVQNSAGEDYGILADTIQLATGATVNGAIGGNGNGVGIRVGTPPTGCLAQGTADGSAANLLPLVHSAAGKIYVLEEGGQAARYAKLTAEAGPGPVGHTISLLANPAAGGTVFGGGTFPGGMCTVSATPRQGYRFAGWTENGALVSTAAQYTFSLTGNRTLVANFATVGNQDDRDRSSDSSGASSAPAPSAANWLEPNPAQTLAADATQNRGETVLTQTRGTYGVRESAWAKLAGLRYWHDTVNGRAVEVRLYIGAPEKMAGDLYVTGFVSGSIVENRTALFNKWFANPVRVIHMDNPAPWGQEVEIAAKVDLTGMEAGTLYFYSYNAATNRYTRIRAPRYWVDKNGYLHFYTELAGDIIVSWEPLERKGE